MSAQSPQRPPIDRRTFLKTVGATGAAALASTHADVDPVGEADALGVVGAAVVGGAVVAAAGVIGGAAYSAGTDGNVDTNSVLEDQIYNNASSVADGREDFEREMQANFIDRSTDKTPYANAAWQEIRAAAAKEIVNGNTEADAESAANQALKQQTTRSVVNITERWNTGVKALIESLVIDYEESVGVIQTTTPFDSTAVTPSNAGNSGWESVSSAETNDSKYALLKRSDFSLPIPATDLDSRDTALTVYGIPYQADTNIYLASPSYGSFGPDSSMYPNRTFEANHSSLSTQTVIKAGLYDGVISEIETAYDNISGNLSTYVAELAAALDQGAIDAADIFSPSDIVNEFATSDQQSRFAAELMAVGADIPKDAGYKAKISHPALESSSLWVRLYPMFTVDPAPSISPGTSIPASDYDIAYIGYYSKVDGSFITQVLPGDSTLEILDIDGVDGQQDFTEQSDGSIPNPGDLRLGPRSDLPKPIQEPANYSNHVIRVNATANSTTQPVTAISNHTRSDGITDVWLNGTALTTNDTVNDIQVLPEVGYNQAVEYVADPTTVDSTEVKALLEEQRETIDALKTELGDSGGGGFSLPDFGLGGIGSALGGVVVLGGGFWAAVNILGGD